MNPEEVIARFYPPGGPLHDIFMAHAVAVTKKSLDIAQKVSSMNPDTAFIEQAAMLHDIGIFMTRARSIGCTGEHPYICHGWLGRQLLDGCGFDPRFGKVCERHTGAGITLDNIAANDLPLPHRDMVPVSLEEKIICVADKFHSKNPENRDQVYSVQSIIRNLAALDPGHAERFSRWAVSFKLAGLEDPLRPAPVA